MPSKTTYYRWFDDGARKFRGALIAHGLEHLLPDDPNTYPCPLCESLFPLAALDDGRLTAEDVPPGSVGGRKILLTCQTCNNRQGSSIDSHAAPRERWVDSMAGGRITPFKGTHTVGDVLVRGLWWAGPGQISFEYVDKMNNPNEKANYEAALKDLANVQQKMTQYPGFSWETANLSSVRAAYLASFAVFGWKQIFRSQFEPLRRRLSTSLADQLPPSLVRYNMDETSKTNRMLLVTEPGPQRGVLLVCMARSTVVLPGLHDTRSLQEVADAFAELVPNGEERTFNGWLFDWPTEPQHRADPDPPDQAGSTITKEAGPSLSPNG